MYMSNILVLLEFVNARRNASLQERSTYRLNFDLVTTAVVASENNRVYSLHER